MHMTGYECNTMSVKQNQTTPNTANNYQFYCNIIQVSNTKTTLVPIKLKSNLNYNHPIYSFNLKFLKISKCMSLLEGYRRPLYHYIIEIITILSNFRFA